MNRQLSENATSLTVAPAAVSQSGVFVLLKIVLAVVLMGVVNHSTGQLLVRCENEIVPKEQALNPYFEAMMSQVLIVPDNITATFTYRNSYSAAPTILYSIVQTEYDAGNVASFPNAYTSSYGLIIRLLLESISSVRAVVRFNHSRTDDLNLIKISSLVYDDNSFPYEQYVEYDFFTLTVANSQIVFTNSFPTDSVDIIHTIFLRGIYIYTHVPNSDTSAHFQITFNETATVTQTHFNLFTTMVNYTSFTIETIFVSIYRDVIANQSSFKFYRDTFNVTSPSQEQIMELGEEFHDQERFFGLREFDLHASTFPETYGFAFNVEEIQSASNSISIRYTKHVDLNSVMFTGLAVSYKQCPTSHPIQISVLIDGSSVFQQKCRNYCDAGQYIEVMQTADNSPKNEYYCEDCAAHCQHCTNIDFCTVCRQNYTLMSGVCQLSEGFVLTLEGAVENCSNIIENCTLCEYNDDEEDYWCSECQEGSYLRNTFGTCKSCPNKIDNCLKCSSASVCTQCQNGYYVNASEKCEPIPADDSNISNEASGYDYSCTHENCSNCIHSNLSYCLVCVDSTFQIVDGICENPCGNALISFSEECDDGNQDDYDGCSSECAVEDGFECSKDMIHAMSNCYYTKEFKFSVETILKQPYANEIHIGLRLDEAHRVGILREMNLTDIFEVSISGLQDPELYLSYTAQFSESTTSDASKSARRLLQTSIPSDEFSRYQAILIRLSYRGQHLEGNTSLIYLNPSQSGYSVFNSTFSSTISSDSSALLVSQNNYMIYDFPSSTYSDAELVETVSMFFGIVTFLMIVLGTFAGRMSIVVENALLVQLAYFSFLQLEYLGPLDVSMSKLKYSYGWNMSFSYSDVTEDMSNLPILIGMDLYGTFIDNFNLSFGLIATTIVIGLILAIVSMRRNNSQKQKDQEQDNGQQLQQIALIPSKPQNSKSQNCLDSFKVHLAETGRDCVSSIPLYLFLCFLYPIFTLSFINFWSENLSTISLALIAVCVVGLIVYSALFFKFSSQNCQNSLVNFSRLKEGFKQNSRLHIFVNYMCLCLLNSMVIGCLIAVDFSFQPLLIIVAQVVSVIVVLAKLKPYSKSDVIRYIFNQFCIVVIEGTFLFRCITMSNGGKDSILQETNIYMPLSILALVFVGLFINLLYYAYSIETIRCFTLEIQWNKIQYTKKVVDPDALIDLLRCGKDGAGQSQESNDLLKKQKQGEKQSENGSVYKGAKGMSAEKKPNLFAFLKGHTLSKNDGAENGKEQAAKSNFIHEESLLHSMEKRSYSQKNSPSAQHQIQYERKQSIKKEIKSALKSNQIQHQVVAKHQERNSYQGEQQHPLMTKREKSRREKQQKRKKDEDLKMQARNISKIWEEYDNI